MSVIGTHTNTQTHKCRTSGTRAAGKGESSAALPISKPFRAGLRQKLYSGRLTRGVPLNPRSENQAGARSAVLDGQTPMLVGHAEAESVGRRDLISFLSCMHEKRRP